MIFNPVYGGTSAPSLGTKTITANGTYNASADNADGYSQVTVNVSGADNCVANWDFTQSLTDSVSSLVAALYGGCTRDSSGLHFTASQQYATLNGSNKWTWFVDRTIELDISEMNLQGNNSYHYTLITHYDPTTSGAYGFLYRNTGYWAFYYGSWVNTSLTAKNYWSGKTLGIYIGADGKAKLYADGTLIGTYTYTTTINQVVLGNGRAQTSGGQIFNTTITGCRIYRGNKYEA